MRITLKMVMHRPGDVLSTKSFPLMLIYQILTSRNACRAEEAKLRTFDSLGRIFLRTDVERVVAGMAYFTVAAPPPAVVERFVPEVNPFFRVDEFFPRHAP